MAYNKVTIDVEARWTDDVTTQARQLEKEIENLGKKKTKINVDADTRNAQAGLDRAGRKADELGKKNPNIRIDAEDRASAKLNKIEDKTRSLAGKLFTMAVNLDDNETLAKLNKIGEKAQQLAKGTWVATVKIKDLATAPLNYIKNQLFSLKTLAMGIIGGVLANKYVKQPVQMYADREDLVTQFAVLLKGDSDTPNYAAANQRIEELTKFAGETPFTRDEIFQASKTLETYTEGALSTPDSVGGLRMIGDVAAMTGAEYTRVASYFGQLYNNVKRVTLNPDSKFAGGESLAFLREMGALSAEAEQNIKDIAVDSGTLEEKWALIAAEFSRADGMMMEMSNQMNNLMLGVKSFLKNNLYLKLGEGISKALKPFLIDFRAWRNANSGLVGKWANDIQKIAAAASEKVLDVVRGTAKRMFEITQSSEFQNADIFGKIGLLWEHGIKNPFANWWRRTVVPWWDDTVMPWLSEKASRMGKVIGTGLSNALLFILGADVSGIDAGISIGTSFARGFAEGFDGSAVTNALVDAIGNVWGALPLWAKMLFGTIGIGKGAGMLQTLTGGIKGLIGSTGASGGGIIGAIGSAGNAMVGGSGLLGFLADAGYAATGGAAGSTLSGGVAALAGLGTLAGGAVGIAALVSSLNDFRKVNSYLSRNNYESTALGDAHTASGGLKLSGAALGAAIGTAIAPGIGTAIGAGLGGLVGWLGGSAMKKSAAQGSTYAELEQWAQTSKEAAEELERRQKVISEGLADMFGEVSLSFKEIQDIIKELVIGEQAKRMEKFTKASQGAARAMGTMESSASELNKWTWKITMGMELSEKDTEEFFSNIQSYIDSTKAYAEAQQYEFSSAAASLLNPRDAMEYSKNLDVFYSGIQERLSRNAESLKVILEGAEFEGKEQAIQDLLLERASIMEAVNKAESEAKLEVLKIKYSSGELSQESFMQLKDEITATLANQEIAIDEAFTASIAGLKLQGLDDVAYEEAFKELFIGRNAQIDELHANARSVLLDVVEGSTGIKADKLWDAVNESVSQGILPIDWDDETAKRFLGAESLAENSGSAIGFVLQDIASSIPGSDAAIAVGNAIAESITPSDAAISSAAYNIYSNIQTAVQKQFDGGINVDTTIRVTGATVVATGSPTVGNKARGGLVGMDIPGYAGGGVVRGGAQLAMLAEEGTPEMVIPLGAQRRKRGLQLWMKTGEMLGIPGFAAGGLVGGTADEGLRHQQYGETSQGTQSVQVEVGGVTVEVNVTGNDSNNIAEAIKAQAGEIVDTVAGALADAFNAQFENTPVRGEA